MNRNDQDTAGPELKLRLRISIHDTDMMGVVWHGHYLKYFEMAREALMRELGYDYAAMIASGYAWPVVSQNSKYMASLKAEDEIEVSVRLIEWENRIICRYAVTRLADGVICTRGETVQMAVRLSDGQSVFVAPEAFTRQVAAWLAAHDQE